MAIALLAFSALFGLITSTCYLAFYGGSIFKWIGTYSVTGSAAIIGIILLLLAVDVFREWRLKYKVWYNKTDLHNGIWH